MAEEPIEAEFIEVMNNIAKALDHTFNGRAPLGERTVGFVLLAFKFGTEGRVNYISNANRADTLAAMKEFIARAESATPH